MPDDYVMALMELSQDLLFQKIPTERLDYFIQGSLDAGKAAAEPYLGREVLELYDEYGIKIEYRQNSGKTFGVAVRGLAEMSEQECKVTIYSESITQLAEHSAYGENEALDYKTALNIHLAHEFFHFWEYRNNTSIVDTLDSVESFRFFGFKRKAKINRCGEVAAHIFAKELVGLHFMPNFYDYIYLVNIGKLSWADFDKRASSLMEIYKKG